MITLRELADKRGIFIGAAVNVSLLGKDPEYKKVLQREFNMVVPENAMKWHAIRPAKNAFLFDQADELVNFAEQNKMAVRGHTLVWGATMPDWFNELNAEEMGQEINQHIAKVAGRYKGKIYAWDVINEALTDEGVYDATPLMRNLGVSYIENAFIKARKVDPDVKLFWNEWGADTLNKRSDKFFEEVKNLLSKNIPVDGVGFQMHTGLGSKHKTTTPLPDLNLVKKNFERFANLGLEIHITEMDVQVVEAEGSMEQRLKDQANFYGALMEMCLEVTKFKAFLTWGVNDKYSWTIAWLKQIGDAPLLFDKENKPKPAYFALKKVLEK